MDITWGTGSQRENGNITMEIADTLQNINGMSCNMHLICNVYTRDEIMEILHECKRNGIRNILALRGDPPKANLDKPPHFNYGVDLVKLMREEFGDYFGISVAGYPYLHPDCKDYKEGLLHLKEKVDAGSDFVISQLFFKAEDFFQWEKDCRDIGITCPLIPGILPIQGYHSLRNMAKMCCVEVPQFIVDEVEPFKEDEEAIKDYGVRFAVDLCKKLIEGGVPGLHFYTLNREIVTERIVRELNLVKDNEVTRPFFTKTVEQAPKRVEEVPRDIPRIEEIPSEFPMIVGSPEIAVALH